MKNVLLIIFINFSGMAFCQSVPQMQLKTSTYQPSTFTPSTYTPQQPDYSILQRSMRQIEDRKNKAYESYNNLIELYLETEKAISPTEWGWYREYAGNLCKEVKVDIDVGNYQSAITMAYEAMSTLRNDKQIVYRKDSYKQYCDEISFRGSAYNNGKANKRTYDWWIYVNQYQFKPKYDSYGNMNGYTPINISWLYENINWNEVYSFITSQGCNSEKINELWDLYFMDVGKSLSLLQEYDVNKFYLEYYSYVFEHENLNDSERNSLKIQIDQLSKLLCNSENNPSFETFINNIKSNIVNN